MDTPRLYSYRPGIVNKPAARMTPKNMQGLLAWPILTLLLKGMEVDLKGVKVVISVCR